MLRYASKSNLKHYDRYNYVLSLILLVDKVQTGYEVIHLNSD